jgi:hypothetical protein
LHGIKKIHFSKISELFFLIVVGIS